MAKMEGNVVSLPLLEYKNSHRHHLMQSYEISGGILIHVFSLLNCFYANLPRSYSCFLT